MPENKTINRVLELVLNASRSESWKTGAHFSFCRFYLNLPAILKPLAKEMANDTSQVELTKAEIRQKTKADDSYARVFGDPESFNDRYAPTGDVKTLMNLGIVEVFDDATRMVKAGEDFDLRSMLDAVLDPPEPENRDIHYAHTSEEENVE